MAKGVVTKSKHKQYKRETNRERRAREDKERLAEWAAFYVALLIEFETKALRAGLCDGKGDKRQGRKVDGGSSDIFYDGNRVREVVFYSLGERAYTVIGRLLCEHHDHKKRSKFLHLVADQIEGKETYKPGEDYWYDAAIDKAYKEACRRFCSKDGSYEVSRWPTFSEFLNIFREQNRKLRGASDRSLRRSLRRFGVLLDPGKRGRPKKK